MKKAAFVLLVALVLALTYYSDNYLCKDSYIPVRCN